MKPNYALVLLAALVCAAPSFAQEQQPVEEDLFTLSLEELMNVPINSASKKDETLFDAPLSSYTITRSDIDKAGSTSIMEALKLAPGVIVREQANGMYDIHIRGMENLTRTNGTFLKTNSYTLVMIDNRPVFNHGLGGTNWESLSIDINDVERIEIVRGPSSPLFGPNAVTGVINIITKRLNESEALVNANVQAGTLGTTIVNASVGKKFGKFSAIVSGNFQDRNRVDSKYYSEGTGTYEDLSDMIADPAERDLKYPDPSRSLSKWGVNGYFDYNVSEQVSFDLTLTTQAAEFQKIWISNPLMDGNTENTSANLNAKIYGLNFRTSYLTGHNLDTRLNIPSPWAEYDFNVYDAVAEYDFKIGDKYSITPGASYQTVTFDDRDYVDPVNDGTIGLFNAENTITTLAGYIRADLNFTEKLRVLAGLRVDKFSDPDDAYLAYEFATTYKINSKNLVRAAITRSNSGSFIGYNFVDIGGGQVGNTNLDLFTLNMIEIGYRSQLSNKFQLDIDVFRQTGENLTAIIQTAGPQQFNNIPTEAEQIGATVSLNFVPNEKIQFKPFFTFQKTETEDLPSLYVDPAIVPPGMVTFDDSKHAYTPASYGGFYFNYKPTSKLNINLSGYYFTKQTQYDGSYDPEDSSTPQYAFGQINGKFTMNAKVSYEVVKNLNLFINARNLFGTDSREFYAADQTAGLYTGGLSYNMTK
ncbi:MAG TPA: TonB-dependent receptor [Ohtaekwangia sp.]